MTIGEVNEQYKQAFNLPEARGAVVQDVEPGKPADKAGIQHGDVVVDLDGKPIRNNRDLIDYISYLPIGSTVKVGVIRNGQHIILTAKTAQRPDEAAAAAESSSSEAEPSRNRLGMSVQDITPALRQLYGLADSATGVVVTSVKDVSAAGEAQINEGDVISEIQGQKITSADQFRRIVEGLKSGEWIRVYVSTANRGGRPIVGYRTMQVP